MDRTRFWVGVDTGGTFTDFVALGPSGEVYTGKVPSTPDDPGRAVVTGLSQLLPEGAKADITYGSTVATNALLERRGARTAFITNEGFEDILVLGRQTRPSLYSLRVTPAPPLVPADLCFGLSGRLKEDGGELSPLSEEELAQLRTKLSSLGVESVAVCLLHSYANGAHEEAVGRALSSLGVPLSLSSEILPEYREYERAATTTVNAYVAPKMSGHLRGLAAALADRTQKSLRVMQSNGGAVQLETAAREPVRTVLSGPAGGVVGALAAAKRAGFDRVITFDMGGTSTDVSLCEGKIRTTSEGQVAGFPVRVPLVDVHTVGAGGGSIARIDEGGALKVGPQSAGATPGPASYGQGGPATVTDANLLLGRIDPSFPLGGTLTLQPDAAREALRALASVLQKSPEEMAEGIVRVANAAMEKAIRVISLERGFDPRDFALLSFGGSGGLHACDLAEMLSIPVVIIPPDAGVLSALGMLEADVVRDFSKTFLASAESTPPEAVESAFSPLVEQAAQELADEGFSPESVTVFRSLDLRYRGQSFEVTVPYGVGWIEEFHRAYEKRYGYALREREVELVTLRVRAVGTHPMPARPLLTEGEEDASSARVSERKVVHQGAEHTAAVYLRERLSPGMRFGGPAVVAEPIATTWVPPGWEARIHPSGAILLRPL